MPEKFPIFTITPDLQDPNETPEEEDGYLTKFWIDHPELGYSLVKIDLELTASAWSEKVPYELAKLLKLPCARYEFGELSGFDEFAEGTRVVISPNFRQSGFDYFKGLDLLAEINPNYNYTLGEVIDALQQANVKIPHFEQMPTGVNDATDLFVGYLLLDVLVANDDRHAGNWGYNESQIDGIRRLSPTYDHGMSLGVIFDAQDLRDISVERYMERTYSSLGDRHLDIFFQATSLRSTAAKVWLEQLERITSEQINKIFDRIPEERISTESAAFAKQLLIYNRQQLLT